MLRVTLSRFALVAGAAALTACNSDIETLEPNLSYQASDYGTPVLCGDGMDWASDAEVAAILDDAAYLLDGQTLEIPAGCYQFEGELTFSNRSNITIKGAGIDQTYMDFSKSSSGEGISVLDSVNVVISDLQVSEAAKNAIKVTNTDGLIIRDVAAIWMEVPRQPDAEGRLRGTYALYPVQSRNILIENTWSYGSADAGVYVGQSENVVVRNNVAEKNIAGIEIENTRNADVYGNLALGNTGGVLVFDLPGAAVGQSMEIPNVGPVPLPTTGNITSNVRVFDNIIRDNNLDNYVREACRPDCGFAGGVHIVPPGTGIVVLSARDTEFYNNTISNHDSLVAAITSYLIAEDNTEKYIPGNGQEGDAMMWGWNPVPTNIYFHNNQVENAGSFPRGDLIDDMVLGYALYHGAYPNLLWDGVGESVIRAGQLGDQLGADLAFKPISDGLQAQFDQVNAALAGFGQPPIVPDGFWNYLKQWDESDNLCVEGNQGEMSLGSLYDGTDPQASEKDPTFLFEASQASLFNCSGLRQTGGTAVINGVEYGFAEGLM